MRRISDAHDKIYDEINEFFYKTEIRSNTDKSLVFETKFFTLGWV